MCVCFFDGWCGSDVGQPGVTFNGIQERLIAGVRDIFPMCSRSRSGSGSGSGRLVLDLDSSLDPDLDPEDRC